LSTAERSAPAEPPAPLEDFNRFESALCDAARAVLLLDLFAATPVIFASFVFARATDFALVFSLDFSLEFSLGFSLDFALTGQRGVVLEVFLRDFLDIRLPFVAFGGSIMGVLRVLSDAPESGWRLGKSDGTGVWLPEIRRTCSLVKGAVSAR